MSEEEKIEVTPKSRVSATTKQAVAIIIAFVSAAWYVKGGIDNNTAVLQSIKTSLDGKETIKAHEQFVWYANQRGKFPLPYEAEYTHETTNQGYPGEQPAGPQ